MEINENPPMSVPAPTLKTDNTNLYVFFSVTLLIISACLTFYGLHKMFDNDYDDRIVGGDAYNYIIYATRATAWICSGIVAALIGTGLGVLAILEKVKEIIKHSKVT